MCGFGGNLRAADLMLMIMTVFLTKPNFQVHGWYLCGLEELDVPCPFCPSCATKITQLRYKLGGTFCPRGTGLCSDLESVLLEGTWLYRTRQGEGTANAPGGDLLSFWNYQDNLISHNFVGSFFFKGISSRLLRNFITVLEKGIISA